MVVLGVPLALLLLFKGLDGDLTNGGTPVVRGGMLPHSGGEFGPDVLIGWPNRLFMVANGAWLMMVSWRTARLSR